MTKHGKAILGTALVMAVILSLFACLNPVGFSPELKFTVDANISGDLDVYNANNAVLWVINKTDSVKVDTQTIAVMGTQPVGYPMVWNDSPKAGSSFASYHRPHPPREAADKGQPQPYLYKITLDLRDPKKNDAPYSFTMTKQLPLPKDYAIFLVRRADGELALVDEEPPLSALDPNDTTNPPLPPPSAQGRFPLIVRNVTKSADIEAINFGNYLTEAQAVYGNMNDQKTWYLPADDYSPTYVSYRIKNSGTTGESVHNNVGPRVTVIDKNVTADSASWHLLFLYFYLSKDGTYKITQRWPPEMNDVDEQGNINGDYSNARIRVLNKVSATEVISISLAKNNDYYTVESDRFDPVGPIGTGFDLNRDSKVAKYSPTGQAGFGPFTGEAYDVKILMNDNRYNSTRPGKILVTRKGINLMVGETYVIILNPSDVNEGEDVVVAPPPPINYTVSANGGTGDPRSPGYDTTTLTFTFLSPPASTPVMQKVSGAAALGTLTMVNATTYTATCSTSVVTQENLVVKCTTAGINQDDKTVVVYKHNSAPPSIVTTYRYIYKDSGLVPGSKGTSGNPVIRNGGAQSLQWFFEYETVTYENGVETARAATRKDQYGIWSRDTYSLANYISFNQVENTSASITVGNRGNPFYAYDDAAYYVNGKWPYKAPLTFGKQDKTFWGVTHVNVGTNVVDGHVIENMPRSDLTLYLLGPMTYPNELYGHQIDIMVTQ